MLIIAFYRIYPPVSFFFYAFNNGGCLLSNATKFDPPDAPPAKSADRVRRQIPAGMAANQLFKGAVRIATNVLPRPAE